MNIPKYVLYLCLSVTILSGCAANAPFVPDNETVISEISSEVTPEATPIIVPPLPTVTALTAVSPEPYCGDMQPITEPFVPAHYTVQIVRQFPHDPNAFTQGLVYFNGRFYEGTGLRGQSTVRLVDLESGAVEKQIVNTPSEFGEGTAVFNNQLYQLTWQSGIGYVYDLDSFAQVRSFSYVGEGWGLTTNGRCLIMSNGSSNLTYRDPQTFEVLGTLPVQDNGTFITQLNELEYINGEIWSNIWKQNQIARISPTSGQVIGWIDASSLAEIVRHRDGQAVLNGIAFDEENGRVFLTGKLWPTLFEVEIVKEN